jgi:hypothetical protein
MSTPAITIREIRKRTWHTNTVLSLALVRRQLLNAASPNADVLDECQRAAFRTRVR